MQINPVIGHSTASKRLSQSRYSCAMSNPGLMFYIDKPQRPGKAVHGQTLFVVNGGRAQGGNSHGPVDFLALIVFLHKGFIPGIFDQAGNAFFAPVPVLGDKLFSIRFPVKAGQGPFGVLRHLDGGPHLWNTMRPG